MNSLRFRFLWPLTLFGFLPALGAARLMGQPIEGFFGLGGLLLGTGVILMSYLISGWVLKPVVAVMNATASLLRGIPPTKRTSEWLPGDFWKLRCDINTLFAKHRQSLNAAESHACQSAQQLMNAERLLREAFTALQGVFSACDEGVAVIDSHGKVIASNKKLDEFLGQPLETIGTRDAESLLQAVAARFTAEEKLATWIKGAEADPNFEAQIEGDLAGDSGRTFCLRTTPMQTDTGEIIGRLWLVRDCTQVKGLQRQLQESQKLGTIGQLAGGIAHDFNNMLTAIRGNLTLAELAPDTSTEAVRDKIQNANEATERAADLAKQLLGYSRRGTVTKQRSLTDLKGLLYQVQNLLKHSIDPRITLRLHSTEAPCFTLADATQVEQVLLNLCLNSRDALEGKPGVIELGIDSVTHSGPGLDRNGAEPADFVMITVRDNGRGISAQDRHRIFEPFFTTKDGTGTGLGLSMAQEIIRDHAGWIEFDSVEGQGTEFRLFIPRAPDLTAKAEVPQVTPPVLASLPAMPINGKRGNILVVDDEALVRKIAVHMLGFLGYRTVEAEDGQAALDIIDSGTERIDAIMLDIYMPRLSGRDTFKQLRAAGNDVPIVICSGFVVDPDEFAILGESRCPPADILLKPYSLEALSKAMAKATKTTPAPEILARPMQPVMSS
ncbi:MAG TPA: ATP-binding protein [Prosthecobacter sp.]|nr:ATP-binding protein [Prosthecobacter sp.]